ncbi:hypothetical protein PG988_002892 [Apiospora saccharicola]
MPKSERSTSPQPIGEARHKRSRIGSTTPDWDDSMRRRLRENTSSMLAQQTNRYDAVKPQSSRRDAGNIDTAEESATVPTDTPEPIKGESNEENDRDRQPWETLVVGASLGENLSRIEYKDREILQQEYIVKWHEKHQPDAVQHQNTILARLVDKRAKMKNTHENTTPIDELRKERAIADRLAVLRHTLESSRCDGEIENIKAAIDGYESGQITCSEQFTLIYGGHIVDTCPSYSSFCVDRDDRLDQYAEHPSGATIFAKKGFCLQQAWHKYEEFGLWPIFMKFITSEEKVTRKGKRAGKSAAQSPKRKRRGSECPEERTPLKSCTFKMMLDTGATFPILRARDLTRLGIDLDTYPAQGTFSVSTVNSEDSMRFYELYVGMGSTLKSGTEPGSESMNETGWPLEKGLLGGLCPVIVNGSAEDDEDEDEAYPDRLWTDRLSGIMPLKACYVSSVPTAGRIWMGEDRKDVLGSQRMPPYRRFSTHHVVDPGYPSDMQVVQDSLGTPDSVTFVHRLTGERHHDKGNFTDHDVKTDATVWTEVRGGDTLHKQRFGPKDAKRIPKLNGLSWRKEREV